MKFCSLFYAVSIVMGIPTVKRKVKSYLSETLHSLIDKLSAEEKLDCVIIVFVGEVSIFLIGLRKCLFVCVWGLWLARSSCLWRFVISNLTWWKLLCHAHMQTLTNWLNKRFSMRFEVLSNVKSTQKHSYNVGYVCECKQLEKTLHVYQYIKSVKQLLLDRVTTYD